VPPLPVAVSTRSAQLSVQDTKAAEIGKAAQGIRQHQPRVRANKPAPPGTRQGIRSAPFWSPSALPPARTPSWEGRSASPPAGMGVRVTFRPHAARSRFFANGRFGERIRQNKARFHEMGAHWKRRRPDLGRRAGGHERPRFPECRHGLPEPLPCHSHDRVRILLPTNKAADGVTCSIVERSRSTPSAVPGGRISNRRLGSIQCNSRRF